MSITPDNLLVNKKTLACIFKTTERSLSDWQDEGMPIAVKGARGKPNQYDISDVMDWVVKRNSLRSSTANLDDGIDLSNPQAAQLLEERILKTREERIGRELANQITRKDLIPTSVVMQEWSEIVSDTVSRIRLLPVRIRKRIAGLEDLQEIEKRINVEVEKVCLAMSQSPTYEIDEDTRDDEETKTGQA